MVERPFYPSQYFSIIIISTNGFCPAFRALRLLNQLFLSGKLSINSGLNETSLFLCYVQIGIPHEEFVKLSSDGALNLQTKAVAGCFLRDHLCHFIVGLTSSLGSCTVINADLWGIHKGKGLQLTLSRV